MQRAITLTKEADEEINRLACALGFTREETVHYAVRLVGACLREGLLTDVPERLWPEEAGEAIGRLRSTGTQGKVIAFRRRG